MKRNLLARLQTNGWAYLLGALLLLIGVPLYHYLLLQPPVDTLVAAADGQKQYLLWLGSHGGLYIGGQVLFLVILLLFCTMPYTLFRIIIAQELLTQDEDEDAANAFPAEPWKGRGMLVIATWAGFLGFVSLAIGSIGRAIYFPLITQQLTETSALPIHLSGTSDLFRWLVDTVGYGLLAFTLIVHGWSIARKGSLLWPWGWIVLALTGIAVGCCLAINAVGAAFHFAPTIITTFAVFALGLWYGFLGSLLVRLKAA